MGGEGQVMCTEECVKGAECPNFVNEEPEALWGD